MDNLVDLHAHILPGLDDGADNMAETLQMLEVLEGIGYGHVFATPHHRLYSWEGIGAETVEESVLSVAAAAREKGLGIRILPGMEFDLDETLPVRASSIPGGAGHMLVDIGFWGVPRDLGELIAKVMGSGADVLLVHPERNRDLCRMRQELSRLISTGVKLVGNLGSFSGMYGRKVRRDARDLLKHGFYWAVASDLHSPDQSDWIKDGLKELAQLAGGSAVQELTSIRPMQLIEAMENGH